VTESNREREPSPTPGGDRAAEEDQYVAARRQHLQELAALGIEPWPYRWERTHSVGEVLTQWDDLCGPAGEGEDPPRLRLAGRLMTMRRHGKTFFTDLLDATGSLQLYVKKDTVGDQAWAVGELLDLGDWIGVEGTLMVTRTGERTLAVESLAVLAKSLRPIPTPKTTTDPDTGEETTHYAFADKELRYRQRYVDLFVNPGVREVFRRRARIVTELRAFLDDRGFLEVETPILQTLHGGASARPFTTLHNALDIEMYLRIAIELHHKRLIVGGLEKVYEIGRIFRNEGLDKRHNPEFTMLELYQAFADYGDIMTLVEAMFSHWIDTVLEGEATVTFEGVEIDLSPPWPRRTWPDLIGDHGGPAVLEMNDDELRASLTADGAEVENALGRAALLDAAFGHWAEPHLLQPVFVIDHPLELSPLAKRHRGRPGLTERFELVIAGMEFANAFSELNDPDDQRERFRSQLALLELGDEEAQRFDADFVRALEFGMPPTGGLGVGIDRVVMLLTGTPSIRDVILFPVMRPEGGEGGSGAAAADESGAPENRDDPDAGQDPGAVT